MQGCGLDCLCSSEGAGARLKTILAKPDDPTRFERSEWARSRRAELYRTRQQPAEKVENITCASALVHSIALAYLTTAGKWDPGRSAAGGLVSEPEAGDNRPRALLPSEGSRGGKGLTLLILEYAIHMGNLLARAVDLRQENSADCAGFGFDASQFNCSSPPH